MKLLCWYSKCFGIVRWGNSLSSQFHVCAGVRQGGVLSPVLFAVFINSLIVSLRHSGLGAFMGSQSLITLVVCCMLMILC